MKTSKTFGTIGAALIAAATTLPAFATCPTNLTAEERIFCITVEGAGYNYEQFIAQRATEINASRASGDIAELTKRQNIEVEQATSVESAAALR